MTANAQPSRRAMRSTSCPPGVDDEKAQASFKNGVLTIKLPQTPEAQTKVKRIEVKNG